MKKVTILIISLILPMIICAQTLSQECVSCDSNTVSLDLGASALGSQNISTGVNSLAAGYLSEATGDYSVAMGHICKASANYSFAFGQSTIASQLYAFSFGKYSESTHAAAFSLGTYLTASEQYSMVLGTGYGFSYRLENNLENTLMIGFNSDLPTLFVGKSYGTGTTGKIGIGNITNPTAKLHIRSDANENAMIRLENTGSNKEAGIIFGDGSQIGRAHV